MNDQEIVATAEPQAETSTLFDELAGLVPEERLTEYYRVIAHTRTLSPNDEMLRILEAMGASSRYLRERRPLPLLQSASCYGRFWRARLHKPVQSKSEWNRTQHDLNHASLNCRRNWKRG